MYPIDYINPISYNTGFNSFLIQYTNWRSQSVLPFFAFGSWCGGSIWNSNPFGCWNNSFNMPFQFNIPFGNSNFPGISNPFGYINSFGGIYPIYHFNGTKETEKLSANSKLTEKTSPAAQKKELKHSTNIGSAIMKNAKKYLGYNEADGSSKKFSDSGEWCADFVTYVVKETYKEKGLNPPEGFGNHRVEMLKQWGIENDKYLSLCDNGNKADTIAKKVNIGDIMVLRENGASHTGIVSKIYSDGSFETIEGNRYDKVAIGKYKANDPDLSGFVQLS